jgi:amino acid transporter
MAEECKDPTRHFPTVLLAGLLITGAIYVLVSISAITLVPPEQLGEGETPLLKVVQAGAPNFPLWIFGFITMFAVANSALINMLMASRLIYGMANQGVLPRGLGKVLPTRRSPWAAIVFTTALALGLIVVVRLQAENSVVAALSGTTALLLLAVFSVVNVAVLILRREPDRPGGFKAPTVVPVLGAIACLYLLGPWARLEADMIQYKIAGGLLALGVALWVVPYVVNRATGTTSTFDDVDHLAG